MSAPNPKLEFPQAEQYAFVYENAHLFLMSFARDNAKFLFLLKQDGDDVLVLDYPGETFTNQVLDTIENIFFVQVQEEGQEPVRYVLGSYFVEGKIRYGAYYERDAAKPNVVLFRIEGEAPELTLEVLDDLEYQRVSEVFAEQHMDMLEIQKVNFESTEGFE